jgi:UDP-glucuronate 4-epimerase
MTAYLVTGAAGFIGYHLAKALSDRGESVFGVDNFNEYYSVQLKRDRLDQLFKSPNFQFESVDLADHEATIALFRRHPFDTVLHMAAQAGVRYSLENPHAYVDSNVVGFLNVLEACRSSRVKHCVFASSSSVYGANQKLPFSVSDRADHPISLYAATKRANELMAFTYSHLYRLPTTGLRFFTVYGPWGRPDMALYKFADAISAGRPIDIYNHGVMRRDFTYIDDVVEGVLRVAAQIPEATADANDSMASSPPGSAPYRLYNIGNNKPVELEHLISLLEQCFGRKAKKNYLPLQPGDVVETYADIDDLQAAVGFRPSTPIDVGVARFVEWYRQYHNR